MLFYLIVEYSITSLALQLDLFLDVHQLFMDGVNFNAPLKFVKMRLEDLVLLSLLK